MFIGRTQELKQLEDWKILANYDRIQEIEVKDKNIVLKTYDKERKYI